MTVPGPLVITDQHLQGALDVLNSAMVIARAYPSPLTQGHMHAAFDHYQLLFLQAKVERQAHAEAFDAQQQTVPDDGTP